MESDISQTAGRYGNCRGEIQESTERRNRSAAEVEGLSAELREVRNEREGSEAMLRRHESEASAISEGIEGILASLTSLKIHKAEQQQQQQSVAASLASLSRQSAELDERAQKLKSDRENALKESGELGEQQAQTQRSLEDKREQRTQLEEEIHEAREQLQGVLDQVDLQQKRVHELREQSDDLRSKIGEVEVELAENRLNAEHLSTGIRERYETEVAELRSEDQVEIEDEDSAATRLDELKIRIGRIGEVNVGAIEELQELEERAEFLRNQKDDLEQSLEDLEKTIQKLNKASKERFAETFAAVNEKFQEVLPRLFRGGEGRLVLTDEHNLLDSGVDIYVRPPGKRLDTVTLLSGGEKALVAVSLIFSLFLINPTPFCILDEVDAPLDEANVGRFTQLVREASQHSQFIVITHNKRTMETADVLYGVTMQEPGLSKVVSVATH